MNMVFKNNYWIGIWLSNKITKREFVSQISLLDKKLALSSGNDI